MKSIGQALESPGMKRHAAEKFQAADKALALSVDRMMSILLAVEWIGMMAVALIAAPQIWDTAIGRLHPQVFAAILAGPAFILPAILLARLYPARQITRHIIAVAQILVSVLLIYVTGGRIETHSFVFGSLAILAFYRDWRVLVTASVLAVADHTVTSIWWPESVYGALATAPWRLVEHTWWIAFEDFFLILGSTNSIKEMWLAAARESQLHRGANYDVLTGLGNRRLLQQSFEGAVERLPAERQAILFIDLDRFKQANDTLGHAIGDKLLQLVAARLSAALSGEQILARIGGDEFVALISELNGPHHATELGSRMLAALAMPFEVDGHLLLLSASVGVSYYPEHGTALSDLQDRADRAMYIAKSLGRNRCVVFSSEVTRREKLLQDLARDLNEALQRGELVEPFGVAGRIESPYTYWLVAAPGSRTRPEVVQFCDWVIEQARLTREAMGEADA